MHSTSVRFGGKLGEYLTKRAIFTQCSLSSFQTQGTRWFLILAGALLGISAALLWSAQGQFYSLFGDPAVI